MVVVSISRNERNSERKMQKFFIIYKSDLEETAKKFHNVISSKVETN